MGVLLVDSNTELIVCCTGFVVSVRGRLEVLVPADEDWIGAPTHSQNVTMCNNVSRIEVQFIRRYKSSDF